MDTISPADGIGEDDNGMRHPTNEGRESLARMLGLTIGEHSQDWEYEVADPQQFTHWLSVYRSDALNDDERFSLMEMLIQCVETLSSGCDDVTTLAEWQEVSKCLRERALLHDSTIAYWAALDDDSPPDYLFRVTIPMRALWRDVHSF